MTDRALLADCRRFLRAIVALLEVLPPEQRTAHLARQAHELVARIDEDKSTEELERT